MTGSFDRDASIFSWSHIIPTKTVALFASKLGYQTRSFEAAARKLGVQLAYVTDRCHELPTLGRPCHRRAFRQS